MHYNPQTHIHSRHAYVDAHTHTQTHMHAQSNEIQHIRKTEVAAERWTEVGQNLDTLRNKVK